MKIKDRSFWATLGFILWNAPFQAAVLAIGRALTLVDVRLIRRNTRLSRAIMSRIITPAEEWVCAQLNEVRLKY